MDPDLKQKAAFYAQIEASWSDENSESPGEESTHREKCRAFAREARKCMKTQASASRANCAPNQVGNPSDGMHAMTATAPRPTTIAIGPSDDGEDEVEITKVTSLRHGSRSPDQRTVSRKDDAMPAAATKPPSVARRRSQRRSSPARTSPIPATEQTRPAPASKRKRGASLKAVPEAQQVFRGLSFFYIPNDDVNPARRRQITRAREYGAVWAREIADATHVIVDKSLGHKDVRSILDKSPHLATQVVTNDNYPISCLTFRVVLNPDQPQYRVPGLPVKTQAEATRAPDESQPSGASLVVKPVKSRASARVRARAQPSSVSEQEPSDDTSRSPGSADPQSVDERRSEDEEAKTRSAVANPGDELSQLIGLVQENPDYGNDVFGDEEEAEEAEEEPGEGNGVTSAAREGPVRDEEPETHPSKRPKRTGSKGKKIPWDDRFACMRGGTLGSRQEVVPNAATIAVLQKQADHYDQMGDTWRPQAYRKAINVLRRQSERITTAEQARQLPTISDRLAGHIEEIVRTNRLEQLEYAQQDPTNQTRRLFMRIYGVGTAQANKWIAQGYRTLEDLAAKATLSSGQRVGIEHVEDLNTRIPRWEVAALAGYVGEAARELDGDVEVIVSGSFRRGSASSGDVDLIVTKPGTRTSEELAPFLRRLVGELTGRGFLTAALASLKDAGKEGSHGSKWHGCCVLPKSRWRKGASARNDEVVGDDGEDSSRREEAEGEEDGRRGGHQDQAQAQDQHQHQRQGTWRRIDLLLVPEAEMGAALLYFTGNDIFNRSMRLLASKKGMRLNQRGLYRDVLRGPGRAKLTEGLLLEARDERRIFEILGVKWREPHERWC